MSLDIRYAWRKRGLIAGLLLVFIFVFAETTLLAQNVNPNRKERKKVWRRWRSNREAYNPYLKKKGKDKPSAKMAREDKRNLKKQKRTNRKQMRRAKKSLGRKR